MGLKGKLTAEFEVKSSGDLFHDLFSNNPHQVSKISPTHIHGCNLHEGEFGKNGTIISWNYTINGKTRVSKQVVENLDVEKKTLTFKEIEGDLTKDYYKSLFVHLHVKTGEGNINNVTWTLEYEKLQDDAPPPTFVLEMVLNVSNDVENHHLKSA